MASRTCPLCQRRYAGLVEPTCVVCDGVGVVGLGAPALHKTAPEAVARSVEVYLESAAGKAIDTLPQSDRLPALRAAVGELKHAGVIADRLAVARDRR